MNCASLLNISKQGPQYGKEKINVQQRCLSHLKKLISKRTVREAETNPTTYFAQIYSDDFNDIIDDNEGSGGAPAAAYVGQVFADFLRLEPNYEGFSSHLEGNEDGPQLWIEWLEATEGSALILRQKRDFAVLKEVPADKQEEVIASGIENVRAEFDAERDRHFGARAEMGYTTAVFCQRACIYEAGDAGSEGEQYFPVEIMKGFIQKYPTIDGIMIKLRDQDLVADWSEATGEPNDSD
jgi:hypothetical protein